MTGATLEMERYELPYDDLKTNEKLSELFNNNLTHKPEIVPDYLFYINHLI